MPLEVAAVVRVQPTGTGGCELLRWQTAPITDELMCEIARVRDALSNECPLTKRYMQLS